MTFDDVAQKLLEFIARMEAFVSMLAAWATGAAGGVPNNDGRYPLPTGPGTTTLVPSPAQTAAEASRLKYKVIRLTSGSTINLTADDEGWTILVRGITLTSNITVRLPGNVPAGWACMIIQEGTGAPRVTFDIGTNGSGESGFLESFGSAYRLAGRFAHATAICVERSSSFRSTIALAGNLVQ